MVERWLPVAGYEDLYEVSDHGRVRSLDRWIVLRPGRRPHLYRGRVRALDTMKSGYLRVALSRAGRSRGFFVHHLVLAAFAGPRPPGMWALHGPGGPQDNRWPENLYWGSPSQNNGTDKQRDGTTLRGARHHRATAKLTEGLVRELRAAHAAGGISQAAQARRLGVANSAISKAIHGQTWRHVT